MNNKELAKLLLKHPIIKKINESQMWDKSIVSRVIAEELLKEADRAVFVQGMARRLAAKGEGEEAKKFYDQAIKLFTDQIKKLDDELIDLDIGLDGASNNEIAAARIEEKKLKKEIKDVEVALAAFKESYEEAKRLPQVQDDEPQVSEAVEEVGSTLDQIEAKTKEFEELAAKVEGGNEDVVDDFYRVEGELQDLRKKLSDEEGSAANATKEPEEKKEIDPEKKKFRRENAKLIGNYFGRFIFVVETNLGKIPYYRSSGRNTPNMNKKGELLPFLGWGALYNTPIWFYKIGKDTSKLDVSFQKSPAYQNSNKSEEDSEFLRVHNLLNEQGEIIEINSIGDAEKESPDMVKQLKQVIEATNKLKAADAFREDLMADSKKIPVWGRDEIVVPHKGKVLKFKKSLFDDDQSDTVEPEKEQDATPAQKLQQNIEKAAETLSNVALAAAGAALVSGPGAPGALAVSKVAGVVSTGLDASALAAAVLNNDQDAIISNGASLAAGLATTLIPAGEVAKKTGKEAVETLAKKVVEKGAKEVIQKTISGIKTDKKKEAKAEKVAKQVEKKVIEKTKEKLEGKNPEEQKAVVQKAAEAVGMDLNKKIGNLIGNFNQNLEDKSVDEKKEILEKQKQIYNNVNIELFKSIHEKAWPRMEKAGVTDEDLRKAIEANKEKAIKKIESIEKFGGPKQTKVDGKNVDRNAALDAAINDLSDISGNVIDTAIDIAQAEVDTSGTDIEGDVGETFADKWIKENGLEGLSLFQDKEFKAEFAKLLEKPEKTQGFEFDNTKSGDGADVSSSFIGNDNLDDPQNLQEEAEVEEAPPEIKTVSKEDSAKVREEVQQVIDALKKSNLLNKPLEDLLNSKLSEEEVTEEEAKASGQQAGEQDAQKPSISKEEEYKGHIEVFDNFFSLDGANDGFMEQFLLKYQSQKLWQFIGELSKIAMEGEERALSGKPETTAAGAETEEEEGTELKTGEPEETNLEEAWNPFKREEEDVVIPKEAKAELKTSLIALLGALKKLKGMTKSYEQNMMKSSANPALDGSSLMAQIQRFVPDIQDSIAKIVERSYESIIEQNRLKDLESKKTEETPTDEVPAEDNAEEKEMNELLREVFLEEEAGMSREDKIQIVDAKYKEMRKEYKGAFRAILEAGEQNKAMPAAAKMLEMAREEGFISLFPSALVGKSGKPHSVKEAVVELSNLIQTFVQTMKDVVMLVKKDVIPAETLSSVVSDLWLISDQLEEYFKVDSKIDPKLKAKLEKFLAKKPENQSLSDIKLPEPSGDLELDDEGGESPFPIQGSEEGEGGETVDDEEVYKRKVDAGVSFFRNLGNDQLGEEMASFTNSLFDSIPEDDPIAETTVYRLLSKTILLLIETLEEEGAVTTAPPTNEEVKKFKLSILYSDTNKLNKQQKYWILNKVDIDLMKQLYGITKKHYKQLQKEFEPSGARIPISLEEALKPIIAKMLKEHHG